MIMKILVVLFGVRKNIDYQDFIFYHSRLYLLSNSSGEFFLNNFFIEITYIVQYEGLFITP